MQQYLYLTRHAHALDEATSDEARPLSQKGHKQARRLAKGLANSAPSKVDAIWQSGLLRALETAQDIAEQLALDVPMLNKSGLAPFDNPQSIASELQKQSQSCLLVGHEPNLSSLTELLLEGSGEASRIVFPKASMLCLSRLKVGEQQSPWQIEWHINHRLFKK